MRRKHCEIVDPQDIQRILNSTTIGRLATNGGDGYPYITAVNFVYHEGSIYFHSASKGEKLDNLMRDPKVCFEVDIPLAYLDTGFDPERRICHLHQYYHSVIIRGKASVVPDGPMKVDALNALITRHERRADHELVNEEMPGYKACKVVKIKPVSISGKSDLGQNKSPEEQLAVIQYIRSRNQPGDLEAAKGMGFDPANL
ncbi:MAG: pyridoxamine 5'-phosphate oxidase family protein [Desulfomonilaceae bacterium]